MAQTGGPGNSGNGPQDPGQGPGYGQDPGYGQGYGPGQGYDQGQGHYEQGYGQGGPVPGQDPNDPTQVMPPVPGGPPPGAPQQGGPEDPHPWETQLRAARDRNEPTQIQPLDPELDPMRRRPQRRAPAPQQQQPQQPPQQYAQPEPQRRPVEPPPRRREREPEREREPRPRRESRRGANPMHIPGLGCLKGCLFMIVILVVICFLVWNFTDAPQWWAQGKSFWESVQGFFGQIKDLVSNFN